MPGHATLNKGKLDVFGTFLRQVFVGETHASLALDELSMVILEHAILFGQLEFVKRKIQENRSFLRHETHNILLAASIFDLLYPRSDLIHDTSIRTRMRKARLEASPNAPLPCCVILEMAS